MEIELNNNELFKVYGGFTNIGAISIVSALVAFIAGLVDGYINPQKCNK
jgi:lactobin A/cerein 7B family class IIb bacteriocin